MLRKNITYTNPFTETEVTEEHYFHISKADMVEMEMEEHGAKYTDKEGNELTGMEAKLKRIMEAEDGKTILATFKDLILRSYGKRSENDRFLKSKAIRDDFEASEAFSQLLFELSTDAAKAAEFTNGVIPSNLQQEAAKLAAEAQLAPSLDIEAAIKAPTDPENQARLAQAQTNGSEHSPETPVTVPERVLQDGPPPEDPTGLTNPVTPQVLTQAQMAEMDSDELKSGLASGKYKLS